MNFGKLAAEDLNLNINCHVISYRKSFDLL